MFVLAGAAALAACSFPEPTPTATPKAEPLSSAGSPAAENAAKALSALVGTISSERPLVTVFETFQRGGRKTTYGNNYGPGDIGEYIVVYAEWVITKTVITPDSDGLVVSMTVETWSADGTPPVVRSVFDDSVVTGLPEPDLSMPVREPWDLIGWMNAQLDFPAHVEEWGYAYAGESTLHGLPSVRYESRSHVSLRVLEFVEANPLLNRQSHYSILDNGELVLDYQDTVMSVSAGEPTAVPGVGTGEGG